MLPFSFENRNQAVAHHSSACSPHSISLFSIPKGACISLASRLPSPTLLSEEKREHETGGCRSKLKAVGSTDRARWAEREEVPKSSPGYRRHRDIRHLPLQSQGHQRSPGKKSCPSVPCLPPSVQTPTSGGSPLPCSHSHAPDEHQQRHLGWESQHARAASSL